MRTFLLKTPTFLYKWYTSNILSKIIYISTILVQNTVVNQIQMLKIFAQSAEFPYLKGVPTFILYHATCIYIKERYRHFQKHRSLIFTLTNRSHIYIVSSFNNNPPILLIYIVSNHLYLLQIKMYNHPLGWIRQNRPQSIVRLQLFYPVRNIKSFQNEHLNKVVLQSGLTT